MTAAPAVDLEFLGRHASAALRAMKVHVEKAINLRRTAGLDLIEAKKHCKHGEWLPFLARHDIAARTAQEAMQFAGMTEEEQEEFRADEAQRLREHRAAKCAVRTAHLPPDPPAAATHRSTHIDRVRVVKALTDAQWALVLDFIKSLEP